MDSKKRSTLAKTSLPSVGSSLDDFLARVSDEDQAVDLSGFDPAQREAALREEIMLLKAKLDESKLELRQSHARLDEARAAIAHGPRKQSRWGMVAAAFVIGGGIAYAVATLLPRWTSAPAPQAAVATEPRSEPAAKPPAVTVQPIEPVADTKPAAPPPPEPAVAAPPEPPPAAVNKTAANVAAKPPRQVKHAPPHAPVPPTPTAAPPPHDDKKPGDSGLYNPF